MAAQDSLEALQEMHQDLVDLSNSQLPVIDGLLINLESHIESFRKLLDKSPKNDASRNAVSSGMTLARNNASHCFVTALTKGRF